MSDLVGLGIIIVAAAVFLIGAFICLSLKSLLDKIDEVARNIIDKIRRSGETKKKVIIVAILCVSLVYLLMVVLVLFVRLPS